MEMKLAKNTIKPHLYRLPAVKQGVTTDGAVALNAFLPASMSLEQTHVHACITLHAVKKIQAQAFPPTANVAKRAVVDLPLGVVVKQVAYAAIV